MTMGLDSCISHMLYASKSSTIIGGVLSMSFSAIIGKDPGFGPAGLPTNTVTMAETKTHLHGVRRRNCSNIISTVYVQRQLWFKIPAS